jgi:antitoxin component YwqK of YwqJK toxin-antitoxin module
MKQIFFILLIFIFSNAHSQTIQKFFDYKGEPCRAEEARFYSLIAETDSGYVRRDYFIREKSLQMFGKFSDMDCEIENGYFTYFHSNGKLSAQGKFVNGRKEGLWLNFHSNGMMKDSAVYKAGKVLGTSLSWHANGFISDSSVMNEDRSGVEVSWFDNGVPSSAGKYAEGKRKQGKWVFYHKSGAISSIEVYDEGILDDKTYYDETGQIQADNKDRGREAEFKGDPNGWQRYLYRSVYFPKEYKLVNTDKVVVVIEFVINEEGKVEDAVVSNPFSPEFDNIALNAILQSPKWKPAINHNRNVKQQLKQYVSFSQSQ